MVKFVAWVDTDNGMTPKSKDGVLILYDTLEKAMDQKGSLGVAGPVTMERAVVVARQAGLKLSERKT